MKKFLLFGIIFISFYAGNAQSDTIRLDINSTVHLIFSGKILSADDGRGTYLDPATGDEVNDFAKEIVGNRLKITPLLEYFESTNLFIETDDAYYNFILVYDAGPKKYVHPISIENAVSKKDPSMIQTSSSGKSNHSGSTAGTGSEELYRLSYKIANTEGPILTGENTQAITLWVDGVFVNRTSDKLFVSIKVENKGNIVYDWGYTGFFIRAKGNKSMKNEVVQEEEIKPIYIFNEAIVQVEGEQEVSKVFVFEKFTIDLKKVLSIELWEDQGDRKILLELSSRDLLSAERI